MNVNFCACLWKGPAARILGQCLTRILRWQQIPMEEESAGSSHDEASGRSDLTLGRSLEKARSSCSSAPCYQEHHQLHASVSPPTFLMKMGGHPLL